MTLIGFLVLLAIAAICGAIGQSLAGYDLGGCLVSIVVGFIGAWIGLWVAGKLGLPELFAINIEGKPFPIIWAIIGSALFTLVMALIRRAFVGPRYWNKENSGSRYLRLISTHWCILIIEDISHDVLKNALTGITVSPHNSLLLL